MLDGPGLRRAGGSRAGLLNRAACHACALVPEPSCAYGNVLLDRTFVAGDADGRCPSLFGGRTLVGGKYLISGPGGAAETWTPAARGGTPRRAERGEAPA